MSNRWLRFGIAVLAIGAAGAAGYRLYQQEQQLTTTILSAHNTDDVAATALVTIPEIKAALHAYVAEGQGYAFWTARAGTLIEKLRTSMLELDGPASAAGVSSTELLQLADRLVAVERRAHEHVRSGQRLLAGEVIFNEGRDVLDALSASLSTTREQLAEAAALSQGDMRQAQATLALAVAGILAFAVLLLTLPAGAAAAVAVPPAKSAAAEPLDEFESSARIVSRTPIKAAQTAAPAAARAATTAPPSQAQPAAARGAIPPSPAARTAPAQAGGAGAASARPGASADRRSPSGAPPAAESTPAAPPAPSLREAATICTELARASQSIEVSNLLARAASVLDATGAVVWMASPDGRELLPAASAGYDERLLARIGAIPRTANNVTASAIRTGTPRTSPRVGQAAAALAIPLLTPLGAVGVLTAELKTAPEVDETRLAVATIFAAQLSSLVGARSAASSTAGAKANAAT